jgi:hypothetical protein
MLGREPREHLGLPGPVLEHLRRCFNKVCLNCGAGEHAQLCQRAQLCRKMVSTVDGEGVWGDG